MIKKWKYGDAKKRHLFLSPDISRLVWKVPGEKAIKNSVEVFNLRSVSRGRATAQLRKKKIGKYVVQKELAFVIFFRGGSLDIVCPSHPLREKWVKAVELLIVYKNSKK